MVHVSLCYDCVHLNTFLSSRFVHLRTFEAHPVLLTQSMLHIKMSHITASNVFCNFLVCFFYAVLCFWVCHSVSLLFRSSVSFIPSMMEVDSLLLFFWQSKHYGIEKRLQMWLVAKIYGCDSRISSSSQIFPLLLCICDSYDWRVCCLCTICYWMWSSLSLSYEGMVWL